MTDHDIVLAIQDLMDGAEWSTDTLEDIASILTANGYRIRDIDDVDRSDNE